MARFATSRTLRGWVRIAAVAGSAGLGVAALCLVVFGTSQKQLQLGVLLGLWSVLIAACVIFGLTREEPEDTSEAELAEIRSRAAELHEAQLKVVAGQQEQLEAARQAYFSQEIELRQFGELQFAREAAARRESELKLEISLRREMERVLSEQLGSLREEVAALRAEVVDKLGGQLRLERIETTRVIGSDLEALQHEIRRLAAVNEQGLTAPARTVAAELPGSKFSAELPGGQFTAELPGGQFTAELPDDQFTGEQPAGRRRAPEPEPAEPRYQGRRRADSDPADRFARADS